MQGFSEYARYLQHPLVLIGFVLLLFFGVHRALLKSGVLPRLTEQSGSKVVQVLLRYGFIIALAILLLGFSLEFLKTYRTSVTPDQVNKTADLLNKAGNRSTLQRVLNSSYDASEEERANAAASTREIEDIVKKAGMTLSPQQLTGLGYLYLITNELDKSKTALLDALKSDPSAGEPNALLAVVAQLQANELMQKNELGAAREMLGMAVNAAKQAQWAFPEDNNIGNQLGYIYKDLAQQELDQHDQSDAFQDLSRAEKLFTDRLKVNDPSAHNGLGSVYYLKGDWDNAIKEQREAIKISPNYTFAWHDLAGVLYAKYKSQKPPNTATLLELSDAVNRTLALQQAPIGEKLPPEHLKRMQEMQAEVAAEVAKLPKSAMSGDAGSRFQVSGVGNPNQRKAIQNALVQYYAYLKKVGVALQPGTVQVLITPANGQYLSYYDPTKETIFYNVQYASSTFWPLRDYTFRALGVGTVQQRPALIAIMSGLATYFPSSSANNPNYGQGFAGKLDQFLSLEKLHDVQFQNASPDGSSVWGSVFWELRSLLDQESADALLLQAWQRMGSADPAQADAVTFASNIIELHKASGGKKTDEIRQLFQRRGLKL